MSDTITAPHNFEELPVTLPPNLMRLIHYPAEARFIALFYVAGKSTWDDGLASATFSYYTAYQPLVEHPALFIHLRDRDLGSDDGPPTHALVLDRTRRKIFVAGIDEALDFVRGQHGAEPDAETLAKYQGIFEQPTNLSEMQAVGMFEILGRPDESARAGTAQLLRWLDRFITEELIRQYLDLINSGDMSAMLPIHYIRRLIEANKNRDP